MIVEKIMKKDIITINPSTTLFEAISILKKYRIRHLPVVDHSFRLVGIVSDRDIRDASPSIFDKVDYSQFQNPIHSIMSTDLITGTPLDFVEEIAALFHEFKISCLPIVSKEKLVGIVTETDLLYTFVQIAGAHKPGSHIEMIIEDRPGILSQVTEVFQKQNINIISVLLYPISKEHYKRLVIRAQIMNTDLVVAALQEKGFDVLWPQKP